MASRNKPAEAAAGTQDDLSRQLDFLANADDTHVACRQRHELPRLSRTRSGKLPKNIYAVGPYADGVYDLVTVCPSCGMIVSLYTGPNGMLIENKPRRRYPPGYLAKGIGRISSRLAREEGFGRIRDDLFAGAVKPAEAEEEAA